MVYELVHDVQNTNWDRNSILLLITIHVFHVSLELYFRAFLVCFPVTLSYFSTTWCIVISSIVFRSGVDLTNRSLLL